MINRLENRFTIKKYCLNIYLNINIIYVNIPMYDTHTYYSLGKKPITSERHYISLII